MPSEREKQNQGQGRQNGGASQGMRERIQNMGQHVAESAGDIGHRVGEGFSSAQEEMMHRYRRAEGMMARNPMPSVLIGFGIGFGLGVVLTSMLTREESWSDRHMPDSLRHLPDSFHNLAESIRSLPDAIARKMPSGMMHR